MRISDWSSDVCSSDLVDHSFRKHVLFPFASDSWSDDPRTLQHTDQRPDEQRQAEPDQEALTGFLVPAHRGLLCSRSEEHTSELNSLVRLSYAVFCLKTSNAELRLPELNAKPVR